MKRYIDKSVVAAEIEKRRGRNSKNKLNLAAAFEDNYLLSFLDTFEVKEVDLEKELDEYFDTHYNEFLYDDYLEFAKHFFELGLKAAQKGEEV